VRELNSCQGSPCREPAPKQRPCPRAQPAPLPHCPGRCHEELRGTQIMPDPDWGPSPLLAGSARLPHTLGCPLAAPDCRCPSDLRPAALSRLSPGWARCCSTPGKAGAARGSLIHPSSPTSSSAGWRGQPVPRCIGILAKQAWGTGAKPRQPQTPQGPRGAHGQHGQLGAPAWGVGTGVV